MRGGRLRERQMRALQTALSVAEIGPLAKLAGSDGVFADNPFSFSEPEQPVFRI